MIPKDNPMTAEKIALGEKLSSTNGSHPTKYRVGPSSSNKQSVAKTAGNNKQQNDFTDCDISIWKRELDREIKYGNEIFHSDKLLGSSNGVVCAMCHPNAADTRPETYPEFQVQ